MAEDTVRLCKRGHPRTPENVGTQRECLGCKRQKDRAAYDSLSNLAYNRLLLRHRRSKALGRMARRKEDIEGGGLPGDQPRRARRPPVIKVGDPPWAQECAPTWCRTV